MGRKVDRVARIAAMIPITRLRPSSIGGVYTCSLCVRHENSWYSALEFRRRSFCPPGSGL
jgi:hypothetical protein